MLAGAEEPPALLHPSMALAYRERMAELHAALQSDKTRTTAAEVIRSLLTEIVLTPEDGTLQIDVRGDLAGILTIALGRKAGTQNGRPGERAADLVEQVKMVAGAGSHRYRHSLSVPV